MDIEQNKFNESLARFMAQNEFLTRIMKETGQDSNLREIRRHVETALEIKENGGIIPNAQSCDCEEEIFEARIKRNYRSFKKYRLDGLSEHLQNYYREFSQEELDDFISELRSDGEGAAADLEDVYEEARHTINEIWYIEAEEFIDYSEGGDSHARKSLRDLVGRLEEAITENIQLGLEIIR